MREADRGQFIDHARLKVKWEKKLAAAVDKAAERDLDDIAAPGTRELVIRNLPYIIPYRVRDNHIEILRVLLKSSGAGRASFSRSGEAASVSRQLSLCGASRRSETPYVVIPHPSGRPSPHQRGKDRGGAGLWTHHLGCFYPGQRFRYNASHLQCTDPPMVQDTSALARHPELRRSAESVLGRGETLSAFVLESVARNIEARRAQQAFVERGLASAERARKTGKHIPAETVMRKLSRRLESARSGKPRRARTP